MKTKNFLLAAVLLISGLLSVNGVFAETPVSESKLNDNVTLNIVLHPIQTITVNADQKTVNIEYSSKDNYKNGVSVTKDDHLEVFSTGAFQIKANTNGNFMNDGEFIASTDVLISAAYGSINNDATTFLDPAGLSTTGPNLLTSTKGGRGLTFNITYDNKAAGKDDAYITAGKALGGEASTYTAQVTYTIEPS